MTIAQHLKGLSKLNLAKVMKLSIREVEEESKNNWVGFVDEAAHSFDVQLTLQDKQVVRLSCDCIAKDEPVCLHRFRMLLAIDELLKGNSLQEKNTIKKAVSRRKLGVSESLLLELNQDEVYTWLTSMMKRNKEIEQEFLLTFQKTESIAYTPEMVNKILKDTIVSVIGKRRQADAKEMKKLVDLLALALAPVEKFVVLNIAKPVALEIHLEIMESLYNFKYTIVSSSTRLTKFMSNQTEYFSLALLNLKSEELVMKCLAYIVSRFYEDINIAEEGVLLDLLLRIHMQNNLAYNAILGNEAVVLVKKMIASDTPMSYNLSLFLFRVVVNEKVFKDHYTLFKPMRYELGYNLKLIEAIVPIDAVLAEQYCLVCIEQNVYKHYNTPYQEILKKLYLAKNDFEGLARLKKDAFDELSTLQDYLFIKDNLNDSNEFKIFRSKVLGGLRMNFSNDSNAAVLYFEILDSEQNYKKMLEVINLYVPQPLLVQYAEVLHAFDADVFLKKVFSVGQYPIFREMISEELALFIVESYSVADILKGMSKFAQSNRSLNKRIIELSALKQK